MGGAVEEHVVLPCCLGDPGCARDGCCGQCRTLVERPRLIAGALPLALALLDPADSDATRLGREGLEIQADAVPILVGPSGTDLHPKAVAAVFAFDDVEDGVCGLHVRVLSGRATIGLDGKPETLEPKQVSRNFAARGRP